MSATHTGVIAYWITLLLVAGAAVVPSFTCLALAARDRCWRLVLLPLAGVAAIIFLAANAVDVSSAIGRTVHILLFLLLLLFLAVVLFLVSKAAGSAERGRLWWILRGWLTIATVLLAAETVARIFPAHDSLAINPGIKFFWPDWVYYKMNNFGHRDRDFTAKPAGTYRVLLLGDSFIEGAGLDRAETVGRLAEKLLNEDLAGRGWVQVYNLGHCGLNTQVEIVTLRRDGPKLDPDLVVLNYVFNDAETHPLEVPFGMTPPWLEAIHGAILGDLGSYAYYWVFMRVTLSKSEFAGYVDFFRSQHASGGRGWMNVVAALDEMQTWLAGHNVEGLGLIWPMFADDWIASSADLRLQVGRELGRHRFRVVDLLPDFAAASPKLRTFAISAIDAHPNAAANRLAAKRLVELIQQSPNFIAFKQKQTENAPR